MFTLVLGVASRTESQVVTIWSCQWPTITPKPSHHRVPRLKHGQGSSLLAEARKNQESPFHCSSLYQLLGG